MNGTISILYGRVQHLENLLATILPSHDDIDDPLTPEHAPMSEEGAYVTRLEARLEAIYQATHGIDLDYTEEDEEWSVNYSRVVELFNAHLDAKARMRADKDEIERLQDEVEEVSKHRDLAEEMFTNSKRPEFDGMMEEFLNGASITLLRQELAKVKAQLAESQTARWVIAGERGELQDRLAEEESFWRDNIKDDAERAGIDTRGMSGLALVHTMVEKLSDAEADTRRLYWLQENAKPCIDANDEETGEPIQIKWAHASNYIDSLRSAVDAAMQAGEEHGDG